MTSVVALSALGILFSAGWILFLSDQAGCFIAFGDTLANLVSIGCPVPW